MTFYADKVPIAAFDATGAPMTSGHAPGNRAIRQDATGSPVFQTAYALPGASKVINLIAVALTKAGMSATSSPVTLNVEANVQPPTIKLDAAAVARVGQDFTVNAEAAPAANPVARVQYYVGTQKMGDVTNPTVYTFDFTPAAVGPTVVSAVVTDSTGLSSGSPPLTVNVLPAVPTVTLTGGGSVEGGAPGVVVVSRTGDPSAALTVTYKGKGAAVAGVDYKKLSGTVTIPAGATKAKIKVKPLAGLAGAGTLKLKLQLVAPGDGSYLVGTGTVKLKLVGND